MSSSSEPEGQGEPPGIVKGLFESLRALTIALPTVVKKLPETVEELRMTLHALGRVAGPDGDLPALIRAVTRLAEAQTRAIESRRRGSS